MNTSLTNMNISMPGVSNPSVNFSMLGVSTSAFGGNTTVPNMTTTTPDTNISTTPSLLSNYSIMNGTFFGHMDNVSTPFGGGAFIPLALLDIDMLDKVCCNTNDTQFYNDVCNSLYTVFEDPLLKDLDQSSVSKAIRLTLYSIIMVLALFGNSLVLLTLLFNRHMRSTTNFFILSLAASDLVLTLSAVPLSLGQVVTTFWIYGSFACKLYPCLENFCVACSSLTLCCIAIERYYAIVYPFKLKFFQTPSRAGFLLLVVWVISGIASFPQALFYHVVEIPHRCKSKYTCVLENFSNKELVQIWLNFVVLFLIPFMIMLITYGIIIYRLWIKHPIGTTTKSADSNRMRIKKRAIKMLVTVVVLFVVSWLPVSCFNIVSEKSNLVISKETLNWRSYLHVLALSSCCYNPIIYTFMNEKFRQNFVNIILCRKKKIYPVSGWNKNPRMSLQARDSVNNARIETLPEQSQSGATAETRM